MTCELRVLFGLPFIYTVSGTFLFKLAVYTEAVLYTVPHSNASYDHISPHVSMLTAYTSHRETKCKHTMALMEGIIVNS